MEIVPDGRLVFVNDQQLAPGERLDQLDPKDIVRIEVLKGSAAARLYGDHARDGVIRIYTVAATGPAVPGSR